MMVQRLLVSFLAAAAGEHNCTARREPEVATSLGRLHLHEAKLVALREERGLPTRLVTANHKTGSFLGMCLTRVLGKHGVHARLASIHCSGGYSANALQINLVRDPFAVVDSGYVYHGRKGEKWLQVSLEELDAGYEALKQNSQRRRRLQRVASTKTSGLVDENCQAAIAAVRGLRDILNRDDCAEESKVSLRRDETYGDAILRLPLRFGLLLESLRALHRDVPYVVASATDCAATNQRSSPRQACASILLDDIKLVGYDTAFDHAFAPSLGLPTNATAAIKRDFVDECDPAVVVSEARATSTIQQRQAGKKATAVATGVHAKDPCSGHVHITSRCGGRHERIAIIRHIDDIYLGGALARANRTITSLALRVPTDTG